MLKLEQNQQQEFQDLGWQRRPQPCQQECWPTCQYPGQWHLPWLFCSAHWWPCWASCGLPRCPHCPESFCCLWLWRRHYSREGPVGGNMVHLGDIRQGKLDSILNGITFSVSYVVVHCWYTETQLTFVCWCYTWQLCYICLLALVIFFCILWGFLSKGSCHLWMQIILPLTFQFECLLFLYLVW